VVEGFATSLQRAPETVPCECHASSATPTAPETRHPAVSPAGFTSRRWALGVHDCVCHAYGDHSQFHLVDGRSDYHLARCRKGIVLTDCVPQRGRVARTSNHAQAPCDVLQVGKSIGHGSGMIVGAVIMDSAASEIALCPKPSASSRVAATRTRTPERRQSSSVGPRACQQARVLLTTVRVRERCSGAPSVLFPERKLFLRCPQGRHGTTRRRARRAQRQVRFPSVIELHASPPA
jgi:hypothetical protein